MTKLKIDEALSQGDALTREEMMNIPIESGSGSGSGSGSDDNLYTCICTLEMEDGSIQHVDGLKTSSKAECGAQCQSACDRTDNCNSISYTFMGDE